MLYESSMWEFLSCLRSRPSSLGCDLWRGRIITSLQWMFKVSLPSTHSYISNFCIRFQACTLPVPQTVSLTHAQSISTSLCVHTQSVSFSGYIQFSLFLYRSYPSSLNLLFSRKILNKVIYLMYFTIHCYLTNSAKFTVFMSTQVFRIRIRVLNVEMGRLLLSQANIFKDWMTVCVEKTVVLNFFCIIPNSESLCNFSASSSSLFNIFDTFKIWLNLLLRLCLFSAACSCFQQTASAWYSLCHLPSTTSSS